jgi:hypothetical protein
MNATAPTTHDAYERSLADRIDDAKVAKIDGTLMALIRSYLRQGKPLTDKMRRHLVRIAEEQGVNA